MVSYVPNLAPWLIWSWAPQEAAEVQKESVSRTRQETEELGKEKRCRGKERAPGKDEIALEIFLTGFHAGNL